MNSNQVAKPWMRHFTFNGLSLQHRLPVLICILLCCIILTFSLASYFAVKNVLLEMGKKRLQTSTTQLGNLFGQSSKVWNTQLLQVAGHDSLKKCVLTGGTELNTETTEILARLKKDSTWIFVELVDKNNWPIAKTGNERVKAKLSLETVMSGLKLQAGESRVGKLYSSGDSLFFPIVAAVTEQKSVIGYVVVWRALITSPQALQQVTQLIGAGTSLYLGNRDGSLWTNLLRPIKGLLKSTKYSENFLQYSDSSNQTMIGAQQNITTTEWVVLVAFPRANMLEVATRFKNSIFITGGLLIGIGIVVTWLMSRNITRPLNELTAAVSQLAAGDYSEPVKLNRMDELGKLASAFNAMAEQIQSTQLQLENKVTERTTQLQTANKDLEAFSYSISHDLRAPLRAIIGFSSILEKDYLEQMEPEAKRLALRIKMNTIKMGHLIDDLLAFSKVAGNDIVKKEIHSMDMVNEIVNGLDTKDGVEWKIDVLPDIKGDANAMRQVWINLLSNAIKYSRNKEQPRIEIGASTVESHTTFYVKDNGVGFDPHYAHKLFKVFQRLHSTTEFEGTGVGLAIVEKIITKHGGKVWAEATEQKGAKFFFTIPAV
ncbi:MAG: ATP-binding protein [Ferruginibacter sp.]|nr:ATP-binding protein [Ferruginibacter sp.]